jgi:hypothetical protein
MHCNMIANFFSMLRLIFKHKQKDRLAAVFLFRLAENVSRSVSEPLTGANLGDGVRAACYQYSAQSLTGSAVMASPLSGGGESNPIPTFVISC